MCAHPTPTLTPPTPIPKPVHVGRPQEKTGGGRGSEGVVWPGSRQPGGWRPESRRGQQDYPPSHVLPLVADSVAGDLDTRIDNIGERNTHVRIYVHVIIPTLHTIHVVCEWIRENPRF